MTVLLRKLEIDLDKLARQLLVCPGWSYDSEIVLEVYRCILASGLEQGPRWRRYDPLSHARYPGFAHAVGPDIAARRTEGQRDLHFALSDAPTWHAQASIVIARAILGEHLTLNRWRRAQGSLHKAELAVRIRRAKMSRTVYMENVLAEPRGRVLTVNFNPHAAARRVHRTLLIPSAEGWRLGIMYGMLEDMVPQGADRPAGLHSAWLADGAYLLADEDAKNPELGLPYQHDNEPTSTFIRRCADYLRSITKP